MSKFSEIEQAAKTLAEWLGDGVDPVPLQVSHKRALICTNCPANKAGDWWEKLKSGFADSFRRVIELQKQMCIATGFDDQLHGCRVCGCALKLKVHVPSEILVREMTADQEKNFRKLRCWVTKEKDILNELQKSQQVPGDDSSRP